jgi:hypothetical protein
MLTVILVMIASMGIAYVLWISWRTRRISAMRVREWEDVRALIDSGDTEKAHTKYLALLKKGPPKI